MVPLAIQVHHAVIDGFHVSRLVNDLQGLLSDPAWVGCPSGGRTVARTAQAVPYCTSGSGT